MLLDELLKSYGHVYSLPDGVNVESRNHNWEGLLGYFYECSPSDRKTVETLVNVLRSGESFREPIVLGVADLSEEDGEEVLYPVVTDGTHRVLAHLITGVNEVNVINEDDPKNFVEDDPYETFICSYATVKGVDAGDTVFIPLVDTYLSCEYDKNTWLSSPVSSSSYDKGTDTTNISWVWSIEGKKLTLEEVNSFWKRILTKFSSDNSIIELYTQLEQFTEFKDDPRADEYGCVVLKKVK